MNLLTRTWYSRHPLNILLAPLSMVYRAVIASRRFLYHHPLKKVTRFPVPVIVVGNITVGGNGKTPFVIWLANFLKEHGYKPGIVSRGYGGRAQAYPVWVEAKSDPLC